MTRTLALLAALAVGISAGPSFAESGFNPLKAARDAVAFGLDTAKRAVDLGLDTAEEAIDVAEDAVTRDCHPGETYRDERGNWHNCPAHN